MKMKVKLSEINRHTIKKTDKAKAWVLENIDKIDPLLARLFKEKKRRNKIDQE